MNTTMQNSPKFLPGDIITMTIEPPEELNALKEHVLSMLVELGAPKNRVEKFKDNSNLEVYRVWGKVESVVEKGGRFIYFIRVNTDIEGFVDEHLELMGARLIRNPHA